MEVLSEHGWTRKSIEEKLTECRRRLAEAEKAVERQREYVKILERELTTLPS